MVGSRQAKSDIGLTCSTGTALQEEAQSGGSCCEGKRQNGGARVALAHTAAVSASAGREPQHHSQCTPPAAHPTLHSTPAEARLAWSSNQAAQITGLLKLLWTQGVQQFGLLCIFFDGVHPCRSSSHKMNSNSCDGAKLQQCTMAPTNFMLSPGYRAKHAQPNALQQRPRRLENIDVAMAHYLRYTR